MIYSMTGYAVASADSPRGALTLELRSVNSRFLDLQFRVAEELRAAEPMLRELIAGRVARGKVDCRLSQGQVVSQAQMQLNVQAIHELRTLAAAAGQARVVFSFHYRNPIPQNSWWAIDDVKVTGAEAVDAGEKAYRTARDA